MIYTIIGRWGWYCSDPLLLLSLPSSTRKWYSWSFTAKSSSILPEHLVPIGRILLDRSCLMVLTLAILGFGVGAWGSSGLESPFLSIFCCCFTCGGRGRRRSGGKGKRCGRNWDFAFRSLAIPGRVFLSCIPHPMAQTFSFLLVSCDCFIALVWIGMIGSVLS